MGLPIRLNKGVTKMATKETKAKLVESYAELIKKVNGAICNRRPINEVDGLLSKLVDVEQEYKGIVEKEFFASCEDCREAIIKHDFVTISHKKSMENGILTGIEKDDKQVRVDLKKYCEYKDISLDWFWEMQALNKRLTLKTAIELGMSPEEVKKINDSYLLDKLAEQKSLGATPDSNTQVVKHMQKVFDLLVGEDNGKITNYGMNYVLKCYTKRSNRDSLKVVCSKHTILMSLLTDAFHATLTEKGFGVEYKKRTPAEISVENADAAVDGASAEVPVANADSAVEEAKKEIAADEIVAEEIVAEEAAPAKSEKPAKRSGKKSAKKSDDGVTAVAIVAPVAEPAAL